MTERLSAEIAHRVRWYDMRSSTHNAILWNLIPSDETSERVPSPPWIFGYEPHLITAQDRWWECDNDSSEKPEWWNDAVPEVC